MEQQEEESEQWYLLRLSAAHGAAERRYLGEHGVETFMPKRYAHTEDGKRYLVSALRGYCFVHSTRQQLDDLKRATQLASVRYAMDAATGRPLLIEEVQMDSFMRIASLTDEVLYLDADRATAKRGEMVRVTSGPLAGIEGEYLRVRSNRCVVVRIADIVAVASPYIGPECVQKIEAKD